MDDTRVDRPFDVDGEGEAPPLREEAPSQETVTEGEAKAPEGGGEGVDERAALEAKLRETEERLLRIAADFENFRKRMEREKQEYIRFANERLLRDLLPVVDDLKRALDFARKSRGENAIVSGIEIVYQGMLKVFERYGLVPVESQGRPFDPTIHEAVQTVEREDVEPGLVVEEHQTGFLLNGRVLRPALVTVSAAPEQTSPGMPIPPSEEQGE